VIGSLPKSLEVGGIEYPINSDFRAAFLIFEAFGDNSLSALNKQLVMLEIIYTPPTSEGVPDPEPNIPPEIEEAVKKAIWFLDVGIDSKFKNPHDVRTMDYTQDEQLIFSAVNAVATRDIREEPYMHWWTFHGLCQAISPDSLIAHIVNIRSKKAKGQKLESYEKKFYSENRHLIDFRTSDDDYEEMVRRLRGE
jgi:hypothetical protein